MARPTNTQSGKTVRPAVPTPASAAAPVSTAVRNSPIPKVQPSPKPQATRTLPHDTIARRAFEISQSPACGSEFDNWVRAEAELRSGIA